jgi:hypothetical protein
VAITEGNQNPMNIENFIKALLAIMLIVCLINMPYGYYQLVRYMALCVFAILAYKSFTKGKQNEGILCLCLALLFQPFLKLSLGREIWNIIDFIVALGLVVSIRFNKKG